MIPAPRWRKVLRDVLRNPTRTLLVVLSIAVGVIAVAIVMGAYGIIAADLPNALTWWGAWMAWPTPPGGVLSRCKRACPIPKARPARQPGRICNCW